MKQSKGKKILRILGIVQAVLILYLLGTFVRYFQFTTVGYRESVPYRHSFSTLNDGIYANRNFAGDRREILDEIEEANARVRTLFGDLQYPEITNIIVCDDEKLLKKLGVSGASFVRVTGSGMQYVTMPADCCSADEFAQEITLAELYARLDADADNRVPVWFAAGLSLQNDSRAQYSEEEWAKQTDSGKNAVSPDEMDEAKEFYSGTEAEKELRYLCAKHDVGVLLSQYGQDGLLKLTEQLNSGMDFSHCSWK